MITRRMTFFKNRMTFFNTFDLWLGVYRKILEEK